MAYVLKDTQGQIVASSLTHPETADWQEVDAKDKGYQQFLEQSLKASDVFRESDIQLARVLEDLIGILIERNLISFTDFPSAAQHRLNKRQSMRQRNTLNALLDDDTTPI